MLKTAGILSTACFLAGCTTVQPLERSSVTEQVGRIPELNQEAQISVGSTVFSQYRYWSKVGYLLGEPLETSVYLNKVSVPAGEFLVKADVDGKIVYCTEHRTWLDPLVGPISTTCFVDTDNSGSTFGRVMGRPGMVWLTKDLDRRIPYSKQELQVPRADSKKMELLYQGYSAKTLRLSYREYVNDFARPAFFQDVSYDIASFPADITFRTVKLRISGADNSGLHYQVLSGF
jgi:hypothetical protein